MRNNIIEVNAIDGSVTPAAYQWDYGLVLHITGATLPSVTEWQFSRGLETFTAIGDATTCPIPDACLEVSGIMRAYLVTHTGEDDGETARTFAIPVIERPKPSEVEPTPGQQDALDKAIAILQAATDPFAYTDDGEGNIVIGEGATGGEAKPLQSIQFPGLADVYTIGNVVAELPAILPVDTSSGYIPDGYPIDVRDLKVGIVPVQPGSGDPSPSNVRPITGWDNVAVTRTGKNLLNFINSRTDAGVTFAYNSETGGVSVNGTATKNAYSDGSISASAVLRYARLKAGTYIASVTADAGAVDAGLYIQALYDDGATMPAVAVKQNPKTITLTADAWVYSRIQVVSGATVSGTIYPQIEIGSTATDFEPYHGNTYPIPLGHTVYGGTLDVTTGELIVDKGYIASYDGETLPSTWMSDRDVYSAGETPTTGAQVVYELAEPQTYTLTPQQVTLLKGINNVFADAGTVEVAYSADIQMYIDKKIAEVQALVLEG